jgi:hypothetical protein
MSSPSSGIMARSDHSGVMPRKNFVTLVDLLSILERGMLISGPKMAFDWRLTRASWLCSRKNIHSVLTFPHLATASMEMRGLTVTVSCTILSIIVQKTRKEAQVHQ